MSALKITRLTDLDLSLTRLTISLTYDEYIRCTQTPIHDFFNAFLDSCRDFTNIKCVHIYIRTHPPPSTDEHRRVARD